MLRRIAAGGASWQAMRRLLSLSVLDVGRLSDHEVLDRAALGVVRGELRLLRRDRPPIVAAWQEEEEEAPASRQRPVEEETTWIEIEVLDSVGRPAPGVRFQLVQPDGIVDGGATDSQGRARVQGIPHGQCTVSFP
ncbi:MAG: hypothetical protein ACRELB_18800, partial [Polyangiaceae bacterium]